MAEGGGKRARIQRLAAAVAAGRKVSEAAREAGVSDRTASRLTRDPRFARAVRGIRDEVRRAVVGQLTAAATEAVRALRDLLGDHAPATARVSAARALLEHAERWNGSADLVDRVQALEDAAREAQRHAKEYSPAR